jgi:hypothetical protein
MSEFLAFNKLWNYFRREKKMSYEAPVNAVQPEDQAIAVPAKIVKPRVSDPDFVRAYVACKSYETLAEKTGLTVASVQQRANKLRELGVALVKYDKAKRKTDVVALNSLIHG